MKKLSALLATMWEADPNKSLWSLMTKAWSEIRNQIGKDQAPLDKFFGIMCPHLNLPSPEIYLDHCGWVLKGDKDGNPSLTKEFSATPSATSAGISGIALSVEDIISFCQLMGYAKDYKPGSTTDSPTFLAQSSDHKSEPVKSQTRVASSAYDDRLEARHKRRAKKLTIRATDAAPVLQQQIADTHNAPDLNDMYQDTSSFYEGQLQFHQDLTGFLTGQDQQSVGYTSGNIVTGDSGYVFVNPPCDLVANASHGVFAGASSDVFATTSSNLVANTSRDVFANTSSCLIADASGDHVAGDLDTDLSGDLDTDFSGDLDTDFSGALDTDLTGDLDAGASGDMFAGTSGDLLAGELDDDFSGDLDPGYTDDLLAGTSSDLGVEGDSIMADWTNYDAYQLEADEDATLPSSGLATL